ncbi:Pyruvate/Phosphoenolpyruvate kinase-like domain-containing protein [Chytriomyces sp. MP71]|nr:Pyruvate/Phosphoenolpyruvate kinase-like domain-containing protein [Chytriomyces sp. MP71]
MSSISVFARGIPRFRRASILYIPGSDTRKIVKALSNSVVDTRVLDLEDSVTLHCKDDARANVSAALRALPSSSASSKQETVVRINSVGSGFETQDLASILPLPSLDAVLLPKVNTPSDIRFLNAQIDALAHDASKVKILASIESAQGLVNLKEILEADREKRRIEALVFAAEDFCADLGLVRTPERLEMLYGRQHVVAHAVAYGLQAIDLVCVDFKNESILREECTEGRTFGFTGKQAIHPNQVEIIQSIFTPSEKDVEYATKIVEASKEHASKGAGAFDLNGKVVDAPVILWAQRILAKAGLFRP